MCVLSFLFFQYCTVYTYSTLSQFAWPLCTGDALEQIVTECERRLRFIRKRLERSNSYSHDQNAMCINDGHKPPAGGVCAANGHSASTSNRPGASVMDPETAALSTNARLGARSAAAPVKKLLQLLQRNAYADVQLETLRWRFALLASIRLFLAYLLLGALFSSVFYILAHALMILCVRFHAARTVSTN